ncbi:MAG: class I adenylate-forming enzyme family protein, partial [Pikeienuella sp.]
MPMTLDEAADHLVRSDPRFALSTAVIRGEALPVFANAPMDIPALVAHGAAVRAPGEEFIIYEDERVSYEEWRAEVGRLAAGLVARGVRPGERVAIAMRNYPEYLTLIAGIAAAGAVSVLINAWWTTEELEYGFSDSGAKLVFADGPRAERIRPFAAKHGLELVAVRDAEPEGGLAYADLLADEPLSSPPAIRPEDDFTIVYTSGSTGFPKGVALGHRGATQAVWSWLMSVVIAPMLAPPPPGTPPRKEVSLCATPLFHVTATHPLFLLSIGVGGKMVLMRKWSGEAAVELIEREGVTRFLGVPTMTADIALAAKRMGRVLPTLSNLGAGGAKRPGAQVAMQAEVFPAAAITSGYGMTETNALGTGIGGPDYAARPESAGRLYPGIQKIRIADGQGRALPPNTLGEICLKSATLMRGYLNKPEATAEAIRDGWLHTGDLGMLDEQGYLFILDRMKNIIIRGGENISGLEIEGVLHKHPKIIEAAAFSVPHERLGEVVGAALYVSGPVSAEELSEFIGPQLAKFKNPERYWMKQEPLIRAAPAKSDRREIRA